MTTVSVRGTAESHLGKTGNLSVNADVYGYPYRDTGGRLFGFLDNAAQLPADGTWEAPTRRSLRRHLDMVSGPSVDIVLLLVGHRPDFSGHVTREQAATLQYAAQVARDIWAQHGFGLRRLEWQTITPEDAGNHVEITSMLEAMMLTRQFSGRPGAIDVFIVQSIATMDGWAPPIEGPCDKTSPTMSNFQGCVLSLDQNPQSLGVALAHEAGHYLGLGHDGNPLNVMHHEAGDARVKVNLTQDQVDRMKRHCMAVQT